MKKHRYAQKTAQDISQMSAKKLLQPRPFQSSSHKGKRTLQDPKESKFVGKGFDLTHIDSFAGATPSASTLGQPLQAKLTIGQANDKYEQEADHVAQDVVQHINASDAVDVSQQPLIQRQLENDLQMHSRLQRKAVADGGIVSPDLESSINRARGTGQPLDADLQQQMGQAMGADFSGVKIHTTNQADQLNRSVQAMAFTTGQDVFFRQGAYQPKSPAGQKLIAHELTHVVQQTGGQSLVNRIPQAQKKNHINPSTAEQFQQETSAAGVKISSVNLNHNLPIQRLSVANTNWTTTTHIKASDGGVGGVLFISDNTSTLVVKPGTVKDEEMIASHLHGEMSGKNKKWQISGLETRFATLQDIMAIKHAAAHLQDKPEGRAADLLSQLQPDTTMIQEAAQGGGGYRELLAEQATKGGHLTSGDNRTFSSKDKIKKESPLKPIINDPGFAINLGRLAAADLFLGHFDRLMGAANLDNLLVNLTEKTIYPIDNVHEASRARFTPNPGANPITLNDWQNHPLIAKFIAQDYAGLADEAWNPNTITMDTQVKIYDDIAAGRVAQGTGAISTVDRSERTTVKAKLNKHLDTIKTNFAKGLAKGRQEIINAGQLPMNPTKWSNNSANLYNQRLALL